jgi:hypothetical protein
MNRILLRLDRLETRLAPAVVDWDGGGADNKWTTAANWAPDGVPQPGDDLVFPAGVAQLANVNDFPAGTAFHSIRVNAVGYQLTGNAIALAAGLTFADTSSGRPVIGLPLTLTGDQAFDNSHGSPYMLTGPINLNGHNLTFTTIFQGGTIAGEISGAGSVTFSGPLYTVSGHNTYTGPTVLTAGPINGINLSGSIAGPVTLQMGSIRSGGGSVGDLTVTSGNVDTAGVRDSLSSLTTGNLTLSDAARVSLRLGASGSDRIVAVGTVNVAGTLNISALNFFRPASGQQFTIIDNDGTDPVVGTFGKVPNNPDVQNGGFSNAPEGGLLFLQQFSDLALRISYKGGDGNDVVLTTVALPSVFAVGAGAGGLPIVNVYDADSHLIKSFLAYDSNFRGGVRVATADVTGDGVPDVITAPGPGGGPHVKAFDGVTFAVVREFMAYDPAFRGGVFVAASKINSDNQADIITGAGAGGGPHVKVFDGATGATLSSFFAYDPRFTGGVSVAGSNSFHNAGSVITGAGPGGGPHVRVFDGLFGSLNFDFFAYEATFRGGVNVAQTALGIVTAPGPGRPPLVQRYQFFASIGGISSSVRQYMAYDAGFLGGVNVTGGLGGIITGPGPGGGPHVRIWEQSVST